MVYNHLNIYKKKPQHYIQGWGGKTRHHEIKVKTSILNISEKK